MAIRDYGPYRWLKLHPGRSASALALMAIVPGLASADWQVEPTFSAGVEYDDNVILEPPSGLDTSDNGYALEAAVDFIKRAPKTELTITPRILSKKYDQYSELDSNDWFLDLRYGYTGQRSRFNLLGSYADESARTAERSDVNLDVTDPTEIPTDNSARVVSTQQRRRFLFRPDWSYRVSQRAQVLLTANYIDTTYDTGALNQYSDYQEFNLGGGLRIDTSRRNSISLTGYARRNEFADVTGDTTGYGALLGFTRRATENSRLLFSAGIDSTEDASGKNQTTPVGELSYVANLETTRWLLAYQRTVSGSGTANIEVRDAVSLNATRDFSEKISLGGGFRWYQSNALDEGATTTNDRDYLEARVVLTWRFTRSIAMDFDYYYTYLDRKSLTSTADSNLVDVWLRYSPNRRD
jgi:hypothetical protein